MADERIFQLDTAIAFENQYIPIDKNGNTKAEKIPVATLYTKKYIKGASVDVSAGNTTISFDAPFETGVNDYALIVWGIDSNNNRIEVRYVLSSKTNAGFTAIADFDCNYNYIAFRG